jgi:hypothetical protein
VNVDGCLVREVRFVGCGGGLGVVSCYKFWHGKIRGDNRVLRGGGRMVYIMK